MNDNIRRFYERRKRRLLARGLRYDSKHDTMNRETREDASSRLAFGLCKKYGIDLPKGAGPKEAWEALKEKTGKSASDFYSQSGEPGKDKVRFGTASRKSFSKAFAKAKAFVDKAKAWRVSDVDSSSLKENHPNAKLHVTDGGSTIAIDNGDIVAVCSNPDDSLRGKDLLLFAAKNGGTKLDSYEGNHGFYLKCGFEPVSWCKWDADYAPPGWKESGADAEDVIFYKFTGKKFSGSKEDAIKDLNEFKRRVPASEASGDESAYDVAYRMRDESL